MGYPDAYCVKCGTHTSTQKKQTVVLQNNARALKGECPTCATEVYKILPKGKAFKTQVEAPKKQYPDAFCVKCKEHTATVGAKTVIMENGSRAMTGTCCKCGSAAYRILGQKTTDATETVLQPAKEDVKIVVAPVKAPTMKIEAKQELKGAKAVVGMANRRVPLTRRVDAMDQKHGMSATMVGLMVVAGTVAAFLAYSIF